MQKILSSVLLKIKPPEKEAKETQEMFLKIRQFIADKFGAEADLMGSVAKNTFLSGDKDLDIFVFFSPDTAREELEKKGLETGKAVFENFKSHEYHVSYAEHPYTKGIIGGFHVEIVPAYKVERAELLQSAVDRTPFHKAFVNERLKNTDAVRLLKKFLKANGCYGSDLKTGGFSGYLCELLAIKYGTFENVLKASRKWRYQEVLDITNRFSRHEYSRLKKKFENQPLIFLDPTDKNRNVAAVLSAEKLAKFIFRARKFLEAPHIGYFLKEEKALGKKEKTEALKYVENKGTRFFAVSLKKPEVIDDILYPQLRRFSSHTAKQLKSEGFIVLDYFEFADMECGIAIELLTDRLPAYEKRRGPSIFNPEKHQDLFVSKYKKVWLESDYLTAEMERECKTVQEFFKRHLKGKKEELMASGVPSAIAESLEKSGFKLLDFKSVRSIKSGEFWRGVWKERLK